MNTNVPRHGFKWLLVAWLAYLFVRTLGATYRFRPQGETNREQARALGDGVYILIMWHEHLLPMTLFHRGHRLSPLVSQSKDGELIAFALERLGMQTVRGSSSRGAVAGWRQLLRRIKTGWSPAFTVDGPRGPRRQAKLGAADLAMRTGVPVLPAVALADRYWQLSSWDRFKIPKPFAKIRIVYGEPVHFEGKRAEVPDGVELTKRLNAIEDGVMQPSGVT